MNTKYREEAWEDVLSYNKAEAFRVRIQMAPGCCHRAPGRGRMIQGVVHQVTAKCKSGSMRSEEVTIGTRDVHLPLKFLSARVIDVTPAKASSTSHVLSGLSRSGSVTYAGGVRLIDQCLCSARWRVMLRAVSVHAGTPCFHVRSAICAFVTCGSAFMDRPWRDRGQQVCGVCCMTGRACFMIDCGEPYGVLDCVDADYLWLL